ncbi:MAG: hypothetical protein HY549_03255 [Elusimicrobia bacterium]|nr:hypothetical protein [Elusimicrobiota bacterium]
MRTVRIAWTAKISIASVLGVVVLLAGAPQAMAASRSARVSLLSRNRAAPAQRGEVLSVKKSLALPRSKVLFDPTSRAPSPTAPEREKAALDDLRASARRPRSSLPIFDGAKDSAGSAGAFLDEAGAERGNSRSVASLIARDATRASGTRGEYTVRDASSIYLQTAKFPGQGRAFVDGIEFGWLGSGKTPDIQAQADFLKAVGGGDIVLKVHFAHKTAFISEVQVKERSEMSRIAKDIARRIGRGGVRTYALRAARSLTLERRKFPGSSVLYVDGVRVASLANNRHSAKALAIRDFLESAGPAKLSLTIRFANGAAYVQDIHRGPQLIE